jgi:hypothetical protein
MVNLPGPFDKDSLTRTVEERLNQFPQNLWIDHGRQYHFGVMGRETRWWYSSKLSESDIWKACLRALDDASAWVKLSRELQQSDEPHEAQIAHANVYWLNPTLLEESSIRGLFGEHIPHRLGAKAYKTEEFRDLKFLERHWYAWAMKGYRYPTHVPALIVNECDENFSIRTRVYRSLGQVGHPASIQCLQEGIGDPHPFARAQAIRSLGWIGDPTCISELTHRCQNDPSPDVRRTAFKALQRIAGFWLSYGEPSFDDLTEDERLEHCQRLIDAGLTSVAYDLIDSLRHETEDPRLEDLLHEIEVDLSEGHRYHFGEFFGEAKEFEADIRSSNEASNSDLTDVLKELQSTAKGNVMRSIYQASGRRFTESLPHLENLTASSDQEIAWNARRAIRSLNRGLQCWPSTKKAKRSWIHRWKPGG